MNAVSRLSRRSVLRGMLNGVAVSISLPFLDCFLNTNGTALAATGRPLPVRFGTWFWGLGITDARWVPKKLGASYDISPELASIEAVKNKVSVLSGFNALLDGRPNQPHFSGYVALRNGVAPTKAVDPAIQASLDVLISDHIGTGTRFRSLEVACTGNPRHSYSQRNATVINPSEVSPLALYTRLFGPEFQDPNSQDFKPDPHLMLRQSVLSAVKSDRQALEKQLAAADRERLDQYFTSLRQTEQQLELMQQKPPPAVACAIPKAPQEMTVGTEIGQARASHKAFAQLIAMALACNQTRVFNVVFSDSASSLRKPGSTVTHHQITHEEQIDEKLGYQPEATWFVEQSMQAWGEFVQTLDSVREGDGTLLDNMAVLAHSDSNYARIHTIDSIPAMIAGKAGGRLHAGLHVGGNGDPVTRIGLTLQQVMGLPVGDWGAGSMQTKKVISELVV